MRLNLGHHRCFKATENWNKTYPLCGLKCVLKYFKLTQREQFVNFQGLKSDRRLGSWVQGIFSVFSPWWLPQGDGIELISAAGEIGLISRDDVVWSGLL